MTSGIVHTEYEVNFTIEVFFSGGRRKSILETSSASQLTLRRVGPARLTSQPVVSTLADLVEWRIGLPGGADLTVTEDLQRL